MKKLMIGCMLGSMLIANHVIPVFAEDAVGKTDISITFVRPVSSGNLPGMEGKPVNSSSITIAKPAKYQSLPKTNEKAQLLSPFLGFLFISCSWLLWHFRNRKEGK